MADPKGNSSPGVSGAARAAGADISRLDAALNVPPPPRLSSLPDNRIETVDEGNFFSPQQPVVPYGPPKIREPRWWDYPIGFNLTYTPRSFEPIGFGQLRAFANSLGLLRSIIETRKDQLLRIPWEIRILDKPRDPGDNSPEDPRIQYLKKFFKSPDRQTKWHAWVRTLLDDLFVIDAATLYIQKSQLGTPYAISVIDGATIKPLIDDFGRRPDPPNPAYQQIIKGLPIVNMTVNDMIYAPMHLRPDHRPYGYSPVEQVYLEIQMTIQRELYQLNYYSEGTIPDMMVGLPEDWTPQQVSEYQATFDFLMQGNRALKSKVRFVPGGSKPFEIKGAILKSDYDEWLARILCFAFSIPPTAFVKMMNRGTAETAQEVALEEGLLPLMTWFKDEIVDPLIQTYFGWDDIEFVFKSEEQLDQLKEMQTITGYTSKGLMTPDEGRNKLGLAGKGGVANELLIITASGATKLEDAVAMAATQVQSASNTESRTQEKHNMNMQSAQANEQRTQEAHEQTMATTETGEERAQEAHDKEIKTPPPKPVAKAAGADVKKKPARIISRSTLKLPGPQNEKWKRY